MPTSSPAGKPELAAYLARKQGRAIGKGLNVLDVGAGNGGMFQRMRAGGAYVGARWIAVEAWAPFVNEFHLDEMYDQVIVADVRWLNWDALPQIDTVFFGDVLEHMVNATAFAVVQAAKRHAKLVVASFPSADRCRQAWSSGHANWFDNHRVARITMGAAVLMGGRPLWSWEGDDQGLCVWEGCR